MGILEYRDITHQDLYGDDRAYLAEMGGYGSGTDAGLRIHHRNALEYNPVWSAVSLISGDIAKLPLELFRKANGGGNVPALEHPAANLVRWQANPYMSAFRFWRRLLTHVLLWNRAYALIDRDESYNPIGLYPLLPDRTTLYYYENRPVYLTEVAGSLEWLDEADVLDLQGIMIEDNMREECDLVRLARDNWSLGLGAQKFGSKFFKNGANHGGILEVPVGFSEQAADNLREGVYKKHTDIDNAFKTMVLRDGAKFHSTQVHPENSQFHETRREAVRDVARWYCIPPHKLGDDSNVSYASLEQENRSYLDSTLMPWMCTVATQCWMKLLTEYQKRGGRYYFEYDTKRLLATDILTQYQIAEIGLRSGIVNADEVRASLNMNPREDGLGDQYFYSNNMQKDGVEKTTEPESPATPSDDTQLLNSTTELFDESEERLGERAERQLRKRTSRAEVRQQYVADLQAYAKPLSLLTGESTESIALRSAEKRFGGE